MWGRIKIIAQKLFGHNPTGNTANSWEKDIYAGKYKNLDFNITAIVSGRIAMLVTTESNIDVSDGQDSPQERVKYLDAIMQKVWSKSTKITSQMLGIGGVAIVPYCVGKNIYFDIVPQNRMIINKTQGDLLTSVTFLGDRIKRNNNTYSRWIDYDLINGTCRIKNKATINSDNEIDLHDVPEWSDIDYEIIIPNCKKLPLTTLICPTDNRKSSDFEGVPITYGCDDIISQINECLTQYRDEYDNKQVKIFADSTLFDKNEKIDKKIYKTFIGGSGISDKPLLDVFDPKIRSSEYGERLKMLFTMLEKSISTSSGILTEQVSTYATATEVRATNFYTYALVRNIHSIWERALNDLLYAFDVLCDFYSITAPAVGEIEMRYDWSYAMVESTTETFQQLVEGNTLGAIETAELRQYIKPGETLKEARQVVNDIKNNEPQLSQMIGGADDVI